MSRQRRFQHLEGQRAPDRSASRPERDASLEALPVACASCGAALPTADEGCLACSPSTNAASPGASRRSARFSRVANGAVAATSGPDAAGSDAALPPPEPSIASTVPAWRGEALPPDLAAEVRQKLGLPEPAVEEARPSSGFPGWLQAAIAVFILAWTTRRIARAAMTILALLFLLSTGLLGRGCAVLTGSYADF